MKPRILIVDDDEAITQQLFWTLSDDYDVVTANDMQTAVRRATIYEPAGVYPRSASASRSRLTRSWVADP